MAFPGITAAGSGTNPKDPFSFTDPTYYDPKYGGLPIDYNGIVSTHVPYYNPNVSGSGENIQIAFNGYSYGLYPGKAPVPFYGAPPFSQTYLAYYNAYNSAVNAATAENNAPITAANALLANNDIKINFPTRNYQGSIAGAPGVKKGNF